MFKDREDAGRQLGEKLKIFTDSAIVLALPRGGVPIGYEVANHLSAPLDVVIVRKLGAPGNPEFGIGAIAEGGFQFLDETTISMLGITQDEIQRVKKKEFKEMQRRITIYRNGNSLPKLENRTVILVDDGLATGVTARAAIEVIKKQEPKELIFAVPVCDWETGKIIKTLVDDFICLHCPYDLRAIGLYYRNFDQVSDSEVLQLLLKIRSQP